MFKTLRNYEFEQGVKSKSLAVLYCGDTLAVLYHKTIVVDITDEKIKLNNGGYDTVSTRIVINRALELMGRQYVMQRIKGKTYLTDARTGLSKAFNGRAVISRGV